VLILNATGAVNFSQGDLVMAGGFVAVLLGNTLHVPGLVLLPLLLVVMGVIGAIVALLAYMPLRKRPPEAVFISTIAVGIILQNGANKLFGAEPTASPPLLGAGRVHLAGVDVSVQSLAIIGVAGLLIAGLHFVFAHTQFGRRLRATAQDRDVAMAIGIPVDAMVVGTFAVAAALAGAAGLLLSNVFFVTPTAGSDYILKAYIAVVIGGWGSIYGAVAGALLIAAFEVLYPSLPLLLPALNGLPGSETLFSQTSSTAMMDGAVLLILVLRPQGLFGEAVGTRP
jgi:branched-chain amino acid transport system permease protein